MRGVEVVPAPSSGLIEFSYGDLTDEAAGIARSAAAGVKSAQEYALREVGQHLMRAKEALPYGTFTRWAQAELGMTDRTARNYMQVARFLEGKPETIAGLPPTTLYALSAPSAPAEVVEVVQSVVAAAEAGEPLDARTINTRLLNVKQDASELKAAQRRSPKLTPAKYRARRKHQAEQDAAERVQAAAEAEKERAERDLRLRPLAQMVAGLGPDTVAALLALLPLYQDREAFTTLLREVAP